MKGLGESDEARVATLKQQLSEKLDVYEKILSKQPYLAGQVNKIVFVDHINNLIHIGIHFG